MSTVYTDGKSVTNHRVCLHEISPVIGYTFTDGVNGGHIESAKQEQRSLLLVKVSYE